MELGVSDGTELGVVDGRELGVFQGFVAGSSLGFRTNRTFDTLSPDAILLGMLGGATDGCVVG